MKANCRYTRFVAVILLALLGWALGGMEGVQAQPQNGSSWPHCIGDLLTGSKLAFPPALVEGLAIDTPFDEGDLEARFRRALTYAQRRLEDPYSDGDFRAARAEFEYILSQDRLFRDAGYRLALLLFNEGYHADAMPVLLDQLHMRPGMLAKEAVAVQQIALRFIHFVDSDRALAILDEHPTDFSQYLKGQLYRKTGRFEDANAVFARMLNSLADVPASMILLAHAKVRFILDQNQEAQDLIQQAFALSTTRSDALILFDELKFIATPEEQDAFESVCSPEEAQVFFSRFWEGRNPLPASSLNFRMIEHYRRLLLAEHRYLYDGFRNQVNNPDEPDLLELPQTHGLGTLFDDRGIIFIRHGEPDEVIVTVDEIIPENTSWLYEEQELTFHFVANETGRMRLVPYLQYVHWYRDRQHWGTKLLGWYDDPITMEQISRRSVGEALTTDRHTWPASTTLLSMDVWPASFRGEDGSALLELHHTYGLAPFTQHLREEEIIAVESGISLQDTTDEVVGAHQKTIHFGKQLTLNPLAFDVTRIAVASGSYIALLHATAHARRSIVAQAEVRLEVPDYAGNNLMMSDVILAHQVIPVEQPGPFVRNGLRIDANPARAFFSQTPVHLYFEVYNLTFTVEDLTNYEVSYALIPEDEGLLRRLTRRGQRAFLTLSSDRVGSDGTAIEYGSIDIASVPPGRYILEVRVTDRQTGKHDDRRIPLEILKR